MLEELFDDFPPSFVFRFQGVSVEMSWMKHSDDIINNILRIVPSFTIDNNIIATQRGSEIQLL